MCAQRGHLMDGSYALALLENTELGLAFQKSEQKAADHLSHQPHHFADRNTAQRREVIYPGDPQGNPQPPAPASKLGAASVSAAKLVVLSVPCFDRESTPYQFPNLADSLGASFSSKLPCTVSTQPLLLFFQCPSPPRGPRIFCLCTGRLVHVCTNPGPDRHTNQLRLAQECAHRLLSSFLHT